MDIFEELGIDHITLEYKHTKRDKYLGIDIITLDQLGQVIRYKEVISVEKQQMLDRVDNTLRQVLLCQNIPLVEKNESNRDLLYIAQIAMRRIWKNIKEEK